MAVHVKYLDRIICSSTPLRVTVMLSEVEAQNMKLILTRYLPGSFRAATLRKLFRK